MGLTIREIFVVGYSVSHGGTKARRRGKTVKGNRVRDENSSWNLVRFPAFLRIPIGDCVQRERSLSRKRNLRLWFKPIVPLRPVRVPLQ